MPTESCRQPGKKNPEDLEWSSGPPLDISSPRQATRRFACAHDMLPQRLGRLSDFAQGYWTAEIYNISWPSVRQRQHHHVPQHLVERNSTSSLATESSLNVLVVCVLVETRHVRRRKFWRCAHPTSSCEAPSLPRTPSPPCLPALSLQSLAKTPQHGRQPQPPSGASSLPVLHPNSTMDLRVVLATASPSRRAREPPRASGFRGRGLQLTLAVSLMVRVHLPRSSWGCEWDSIISTFCTVVPCLFECGRCITSRTAESPIAW